MIVQAVGLLGCACGVLQLVFQAWVHLSLGVPQSLITKFAYQQHWSAQLGPVSEQPAPKTHSAHLTQVSGLYAAGFALKTPFSSMLSGGGSVETS